MNYTAEEFPITRVSLNLTRACNLACSYCFTNGCTKGAMPKDVAFRTVDFLVRNALKCQGQERSVDIAFWGGEPFIEWNLMKEIVLYAKQQAAQDAMPTTFGGTTNGTLLTPDKFDFLDEHMVYFMISFDGTPESHNMYRKFRDGRGSHATVEKNAKEALKRWPWYRARLSPIAQRIDHFCEDMKYLFELGFNYLMFSPVYETGFTEEHWKIFEEQCYMLIDYMAEQRAKGRVLEIEHFKTYAQGDSSRWPCGAGRFYVGIDIDGAIYPCHRFNKFNDERPWHEKEVCIGHIDHGITRPDFREKFLNYDPMCGGCARILDTPCHGGCYAVNFDFTGDIALPYIGICKYVDMQKRVSEYYLKKLPPEQVKSPGQSCVCNNMCYLENTEYEIRTVDQTSEATCICHNANYTGPKDLSLARPLTKEERAAPDWYMTEIDRRSIRTIFRDIDKRLRALEGK
jgi:uncharacterized protein